MFGRIKAGRMNQALALAGDLAGAELDAGTAALGRVLGPPLPNASVVSALLLEEREACAQRGKNPWAKVQASAAFGPGDEVSRALGDMLGSAQPGVWLVHAGQAAVDPRLEACPALASFQRRSLAEVVGYAHAGGGAGIALAAALIATGVTPTAVVTSQTRDHCLHVSVLVRPA
jgi:hypothetical protein